MLTKTSGTPDATVNACLNRPLVNYLWITPLKTEFDSGDPVCAVNLGNIECAVSNANKYPEADFLLWLDKKTLDEYSQFCIESFIKDYSKHKNIKIQDLRNIPDYANNPFFIPPDPSQTGSLLSPHNRQGKKNVYARADYARVLVLGDRMQNMPHLTCIIYSDIDCPDIQLGKTLEIIEKHGIAINYIVGTEISNGYIGINPHKRCIKTHYAELKFDSRELAHQGFLGYPAFGRFLEKIEAEHEGQNEDYQIAIFNLVSSVFTEPDNVSYTPKGNFKTWQSKQAARQNAVQGGCALDYICL